MQIQNPLPSASESPRSTPRRRHWPARTVCGVLVAALLPAAHAQDMVRPPAGADDLSDNSTSRVVVVGRADDLVGVATSSSEGVISAADLATRPLLRPGEIVETIPGVIVTQHSGSGKANQYFLRGFNLDHGTDLATDFEGMPINMPSHAHGQGYTDLNFLIPELVSDVGLQEGELLRQRGRLRQRRGV